MGKSFNYELHECLCNDKKARLNEMMDSDLFKQSNLDIDLFVELIQLRWDAVTVLRFAKLADDDQLAVLIATAVLQAHAVQLEPLFALMSDPTAVVKKHQMAPLFLVACDRRDVDGVKALIKFQCFDASDKRNVVTVVRGEISRAAPLIELVTVVLDACPGHKVTASNLLHNYIPACKHPETKKGLTTALEKYMAEG